MTHVKESCVSLAKQNTTFRKVLSPTDRSQRVLISINPEDSIALEIHPADKIFIIAQGQAESVVTGTFAVLTECDTLVRAGTTHVIKNTGTVPLTLFTLYAPPMHGADEYEEQQTA